MKVINFPSAIVLRALTETVTDIGQLSEQELRDLKRAVKRGILTKAKGGKYPKLKTVYARPGFDFAAQRAEAKARMDFAHLVDVARGVAGFFPCVNWE